MQILLRLGVLFKLRKGRSTFVYSEIGKILHITLFIVFYYFTVYKLFRSAPKLVKLPFSELK